MGVINLLDKSVSELIAAGEVIERPASVVKELVENSIDSGANKIKIEIKNGGVTYIKITDNGCGISKDDVPKAFLRHATSKVKNIEDINNIITLGFRGEALASICAVSKVELVTKIKGEISGMKYLVSGNQDGIIEEIGADIGTSITVKDLFFNVPARMKFLKKDVTEGNAIATIIEKLALSHPEIAFTFIRDGQEKFLTFGDDNLLSVIYSIFGKKFAATMLPLEYCENNISINGYISNPSESKLSRLMQNFFVNSRYVKSKICSVALEEAYKHFIVQGRYPACFLNIQIPSSVIDVNVHPAKLEVKFANEKMIYNLVYAGVKNCILSNSHNPVMNLKTKEYVKADNELSSYSLADKLNYIEKKSLLPIDIKKDEKLENNSDNLKSCSIDEYNKNNLSDKYKSDKTLNMVENKQSFDDFKKVISTVCDSAETVETIATKKQEARINDFDNNEYSCYINQIADIKIKDKFIGEIFNSYIILQNNDEITFIDKHAAHERLIYEQIKNGETKNLRQVILTPEVVSLSLQEYQMVLENINIFEDIGFVVEDFGEKSIIIREIPMVLEGVNILDVVYDIINNISLHKNNISPYILNKLYYTVACKAAIKSGNVNNEVELTKLVELLQNNESLKNCPHGRPISFTIKKKDIDKQFLR